MWSHRIMLEALENELNAFVTLTFSDNNLPDDNSVNPVTLRDFIKRLRYYYEREGLTFRYYGVGEYGDELGRPHYHLALFGFPTCLNGSNFYDGGKYCCPPCDMVYRSWGKGRIQIGTLTAESAAYIAGYVTKKWLQAKDGRSPPFARMSNRPGIGAGAMDDVASALLMANYNREDVPNSIQHGPVRWPLGRYLSRRLRERMGRDKKAPQETLEIMAEALREMRETAFNASRSFKEEIISKGVTKRASLQFWQNIRDQRKSL